MSFNQAASAERIHIGFFGIRNAGKSSLVNAVTAQNIALVSDIKGTTTDPVLKAMELLPLGPVVIIDTPGIDDEGTLGELRVKRTRQVLYKTDIAILVVDGTKPLSTADLELRDLFRQKEIPYIIAANKCDETGYGAYRSSVAEEDPCMEVSAAEKINIHEFKEMIGRLIKPEAKQCPLVRDLLSPGDSVILVVPIDSAAPKGRLILPQQMVIRDALEAGALVSVCRESELKAMLASLKEKPKLVITDSQAFGQVAKDTPDDILLTSFSILMARYKGTLTSSIQGVAMLGALKENDRVLISEGCTHHRQCGDIGTVKMPAWIKGYTGKELNFHFTSGTEFPEDLSEYAVCIHCGGCMLNEKEMQYRYRHAWDQELPMTNYGIAIAQIHGILKRSLSPFPELAKLV